MRRLFKQILRRLLGAGGYTVIGSSAFAQLDQNIFEAKAAVFALRGQLADTLLHRQELTAAGVSAIQGQLAAAKSERQVLQQELAGTKEGVSALRGQLTTASAEMQVVQQELAEIKAAVSAIEGNLAAAQWQVFHREIAETKSGVSAIQGLLGETHSHTLELRRDVLETKAGVSALQSQLADTLVLRQELAIANSEISGVRSQLSAMAKVMEDPGRVATSSLYTEVRELPRRLDLAALRCIKALTEESAGLGNYYTRSADLVAHYRGLPNMLPPDPHPDDDFTLSYAISSNTFVPGAGNEAAVPPDQPCLPWRQFLADPECGVFLIMGQSNAANHGDTTYSPQGEVYNLDFIRMRCTKADDPLAGASGDGGSVWSRLGDLLIDKKVFERVLFIPVAFGGAFISDLAPGGSRYGRTTLALSRLRKELGVLPLPISAVLWQQGEAEANHTRMSALAYQKHFHNITSDLRAAAVFAPIFVACATVCEAGPHPYENHEAIREGQRALVKPEAGILMGPDLDTISGERRFDGCHFSDVGLRQCAELWFEAIAARRDLLFKI